jgi:hypothetical protein
VAKVEQRVLNCEDRYSAGAGYTDFRSQPDKQSVLHHPNYVIQFASQRFRRGDRAESTVKNIMPAVALERFAAGVFPEKRICSQIPEPTCGVLAIRME